MYKLEDTIGMMNSSDYKDRFRAEYNQLKIRHQGLDRMLEKWKNGELNFTPKCSRELLEQQLEAMESYGLILEVRAGIEGVELDG